MLSVLQILLVDILFGATGVEGFFLATQFLSFHFFHRIGDRSFQWVESFEIANTDDLFGGIPLTRGPI